METTLEALKNAIHANPFDMAHVLIYCDWLEEFGNDEDKFVAEKLRESCKPGLKGYYPEMGEIKPFALIEARLGHYGNHWYLKTPLTLKAGRGITHLRTLTSEQLTPQAQSKVGWNKYKVTEKAFEKLCKQYPVSSECLL